MTPWLRHRSQCCLYTTSVSRYELDIVIDDLDALRSKVRKLKKTIKKLKAKQAAK